MKTTLTAVLLATLLSTGCNRGPSYLELSDMVRVSQKDVDDDVKSKEDFMRDFRYTYTYEGSKDPEKQRKYVEFIEIVDLLDENIELSKGTLRIYEERRDAARP